MMAEIDILVHDVLRAIPVGIVLSFLIGPVFFVLLETSATKGGRAAVVLDLGVLFADMVFILIAYFSSYKLLKKLTNEPALYIFGGAIMAFYGLVTVIRKPKKENIENQTEIELPKNNYLNLFLKGFFLNFINIGVLAFWLALIILFGPQLGVNPVRIGIFFGTILVSYFTVDIIKILLAKQLKNRLTPVHIHKIKKLIGIIILTGGLYLIYEGTGNKQHLEDTIHSIEEINSTINGSGK
jgi:threonine/homoserine/homoserine lactone efflux protein